MSETQEVIGHQQKTEDVCPSEIEPKDKDVSLEKEPKIESPKETMPETNSEIEKQGEKEQPKEQQQQQQPPPQQQQQQPPPDERIKSPTNDVAASRRSAGECRLLPVLVDLRSSLETNMPHSESSTNTEPKLDSNYFHDLCTSDLKTALSRLEDTLKRVDINALTKYTSTLEPSDKFHLLQLISTLVSNLKKAKVDENTNETPIVTTSRSSHRKRANRHTIGVSSEELASARRWLEQERGVSPGKIINKPLPSVPALQTEIESTLPQDINQNSPRSSDCPWGVTATNKTCDKHIKDAINQKQFLQHKIKGSIPINQQNPVLVNTSDEPWHFKNEETQLHNDRRVLSHDEKPTSNIESNNDSVMNFQSKSNKFLARKTKIKRANTIDIPNYLKMQAEKQQLHGSGGSGLRKPIDISDKVAWNKFNGGTAQSIPSFEAKTENDRKFLALINRNNENQQRENWSNVSPAGVPFKSFNYRQVDSIADKNWKSRFSNIKTTFDRPQSNASSVSSSPASSIFGSIASASRRNSKDFHGSIFRNQESEPLPKFEPKNLHRHLETTTDKVAVVSKRFSAPSKIDSYHNNDNVVIQSQTIQSMKNPTFTHAATSPFKKVSSSPKIQDVCKFNNKTSYPSSDKPISSCYLPACASGGLLKAKVKLFDNQPQGQISKSFNNALPQTYQPRSIKRDNNKYQQFYVNNNDQSRLNDLRRVQELQNLQKVSDESSDAKLLNHNCQSVAVQTSARSTPKPPSPPPQPIIQETPFYKPPETKEFYAESENPLYVPPSAVINPQPELPLKINENCQLDTNFDKHIENQDLTEDKIITRYTAAIATVATPSSSQIKPGQPLILRDDMHNYVPSDSTHPPIDPILTNHFEDDAQRHNMLQLSLIKKLQNQSIIGDNEPRLLPPEPEPKVEPEPLLIGVNNTQDKIHIFEEKCQPLPKINVTSPPTKITTPPSFLSNTTKSCMDSSDEYLVSCSNRPRRSIVLSKSESWHQLALAAVPSSKHLQVPPPAVSKPPPMPISPLSSIKHFDSAKQLKKMEEKVQRYFHNPGSTINKNDNQQLLNSSSQITSRSEQKTTKRIFSQKKVPNPLARSQTMPHVFDETYDVDKAFDSLFEEATRDTRH